MHMPRVFRKYIFLQWVIHINRREDCLRPVIFLSDTVMSVSYAPQMALPGNKPRALEAREGEDMTHPCEEERHAAMADRTVISLAYTPEIYALKRAQQRAREAWRQAQELSQRLVVGPALHMHPAIIALVHVIARSAARATMLGTGDATGHVSLAPPAARATMLGTGDATGHVLPSPPAARAATAPTPDTGSTMSKADSSMRRSRFDPVSVPADRVKDRDDHGDANGHGTDDAEDFGDVSF
jgi:hypothetical protein